MVKLKVKTTPAKMGIVMRNKQGGFKPYYFSNTWSQGLFALFYFLTKGKFHLAQLVKNVRYADH